MELIDQTALITGGTAGIGLACARLLAREGTSVIITGRDAERGKAAAAGINGNVRFIQTDLSDIESVKSLVAQAGDVGMLVNNAASFPAALTVYQEVTSFEKTFDTNVRGTYFLAAGLLPGMLKRGRTWAAEFGSRGIRVNSVAPGPTKTEGIEGEWGETNEELGRALPLGRTRRTRRDRPRRALSASPRASFITGSTLHADGGGAAI